MMKNETIKNKFGCDYIKTDKKLYPLQRWYNQLLDKKISEITVSDVLKMIRQDEFIDVAIVKALNFLKSNPLEGELYEGELLEKIYGLDDRKIICHLNELDSILCQGLIANETYEWGDNNDKEEYERIVKMFYERINEMNGRKDEKMEK